MTNKIPFRRGFTAAGLVLTFSATFLPASAQGDAFGLASQQSQDSFDSTGVDPGVSIQGVWTYGKVNGPYKNYLTGTQDDVPFVEAPILQGSTNGTIAPGQLDPEQAALARNDREGSRTITGDSVPVRDDEFRRATRLPDARVLLGESICDQSARPIACDEVKIPASFPPLPKQITISKDLTDAQVHHDPVPSRLLDFSFPINLSGKGPLFRVPNVDDRRNLPPEVMVPASSVEAMSNANIEASDNPDYESRFAAYCMQIQHTGQVPTYLDAPISLLRQALGAEPSAYLAMAQLKLAIAKIPASNASASERARLAERLEGQGKLYDALVERLRCVDICDDGPSRLKLALLYNRLKERKLAFELLREAAEKSWSRSQYEELAQVHQLMGDYIYYLAQDAKKSGNLDLYMVRLRNGSACYRRCLCLKPSNEVTNALMRICREAIALDHSFDNHLMMGSVALIAGDLERADNAYIECAAISARDPRLNQARRIYQLAVKGGVVMDATIRVTGKTASKTNGVTASFPQPIARGPEKTEEAVEPAAMPLPNSHF